MDRRSCRIASSVVALYASAASFCSETDRLHSLSAADACSRACFVFSRYLSSTPANVPSAPPAPSQRECALSSSAAIERACSRILLMALDF